MAVSHIGNKLLISFFVIVTSTACKHFVAESVPLSNTVQAALYDSTSVFFADFASYGELKSLPIGIFDADTTSMALLEAFESLDCYNNVTVRKKLTESLILQVNTFNTILLLTTINVLKVPYS